MRISCLVFWSFHLVNELGHQGQLVGVEALELGRDLGETVRGAGLQVEELLRRDLEVVTNVEEGRHGGEIMMIFDIANVVIALSDIPTHLAG